MMTRVRLRLSGLEATIVMCALWAAACGPIQEEPQALEAQYHRQVQGWVDLGSSLGAPVISGATSGASEFTPQCVPDSSAPDQSFKWTAPATGTYTFTTFGSNFDTALHIIYPFDAKGSLGCSDNSSGTHQSSVTLNLTGGQVIRVVVDGYGTATGSYALNIYACNSPPSTCHASLGWSRYTGACVYALKPAGSTCSDGESCTTGDRCTSSGVCQGTWRSCPSGHDCINGVCRDCSIYAC
jgi:hypothetical protein